MSRIGKLPIEIPSGVTVEQSGYTITVKGPKGELTYTHEPQVVVTIADARILVTIPEQDRLSQSLYGLSRTLIQNLIHGVTEGFSKVLEINGVGYRAQAQGDELTLSLGYSHPIVFKAPDGIQIAVNKNAINITGIDKQLVGQVAANIRSFRTPEPYKGKGIKYSDEHIRRKAGKTGKAGA